MKKSWIIIGVVVLLVIIVFSSLKGTYNGLVTKEENVNKKWADVQGAYQRRTDLIPNLVSTVKGYANFEQETLIKVIEQRANATKPTINLDATKLDANTLAQFQKTQDELGSSLSRLMVVVEKYPDLKANQNFMQLQGAWNEIEEQISAARRTYNAAVNSYNNACEQFPTNLLAGMMHYQVKTYIEIPEQERQNINARDLFNR